MAHIKPPPAKSANKLMGKAGLSGPGGRSCKIYDEKTYHIFEYLPTYGEDSAHSQIVNVMTGKLAMGTIAIKPTT